MPDKQQEEFDFIKEKIKKKPINKRRLLMQVGKTIGLAVLFGFVACLVFTWMRPIMEEWFYEDENPAVTIPRDTETESEVLPTETETETETESETESSEEPESEVIPPKELELSDYQQLQNKLYAVGTKANKSIVTVTGVTSDTDWFSTPYERSGQASGIIIAQRGQDLLIMTEKKVITDVQSIRVTFVTGEEADATLMKYDSNTGIAILSVPLDGIKESTLKNISEAELGNSFRVKQGDIVIAVGSLLGSNFSIINGSITSTNNSKSAIDSNLSIFTTNIVGSKSSSGVLLNVDGQVIGLVMQDDSGNGDENTLTAFSISQLKEIIEMLSNDMNIPYLGLGVSTVTTEIEEMYELPRGVYIKSVKRDSPAEAANLQSGDVIIKIDGEEVMTVQQYEQCVRSLTVGQNTKVIIKRQGSKGYENIVCNVVVGTLE